MEAEVDGGGRWKVEGSRPWKNLKRLCACRRKFQLALSEEIQR
jgi:hypothetical protein